MKIFIFSDIHGDVDAMETAFEIYLREKPQKTVFCGDLFGTFSNNRQIAQMVNKFDCVLYLLRGNNDFRSYDSYLSCGFEEYAVMYHFNRTLFFSHGDRYNGWNIPPFLKDGDACVFGHTHMNSVTKRNGLYIANVGSLARPRDGEKSHMILDDNGITLKRPDGSVLYELKWDE